MQEQVRMAMKMSFIVLTDFCTWKPLIIIGILVQSGAKVINPEANAWIVTLMMPIYELRNQSIHDVYFGFSVCRSLQTCQREEDKLVYTVTMVIFESWPSVVF